MKKKAMAVSLVIWRQRHKGYCLSAGADEL